MSTIIKPLTRVQKIRETVAHRVPELCLERARLLSEAYQETESAPAVIRRAKSLEKLLRKMSVAIYEDELLVGMATSKRVAGPLLPEMQWQWYINEIDTLSQRETEKIRAWTLEEKQKVTEMLSYFKDKSVYDKWRALVPQDIYKQINQTWLPGGANPIVGIHMAHCCPGYERVLKKGLNSLIKQTNEASARLDLTNPGDFEKSLFYRSVDISLRAVIDFAARYAELAQNLAGNEKDPSRKAELLRIAETCRRVPANPAQSFYDALQSLWFLYLTVMLEGWGPGIGFGRIDQYLYPFYRKDLAEGRITQEKARELIALFYIKLNELVMPFSSQSPQGSGQIPLSVITLGGMTQDGRDAVNELSYLFLEAEKDVQLQEDIAVRIHKAVPTSFLVKTCEVAKLVRGKIKFVSDETIVQQQLSDGKPIELARDYAITGCFIHTVPGRTHDTGADFLNIPIMVELALNNGVSRLTGERLGPETGDPRTFQSYEEVWGAFQKQLAAVVNNRVMQTNLYRQLFAEQVPTPLQSALFDGCLESGRDITQNGTAPYVTMAFWTCGIPNAGDSLAALKKVVFEEKRVSMSQLMEALDDNFEGHEEILRLLEGAPKFGNDDDYVDSIVNDVLGQVSREIGQYRSYRGIKYTTACGAITSNGVLGKAVGALPDGRKAGLPLSEGGISPYQGRNVNGATSTIRSVTKLDLIQSTGGNVLNMRFNPEVLKDDSKILKFAYLIKTFCESGGDLIQFNIVGSRTLKEAQKHPEQYRDLLVRVATYSAYFVDLPLDLQNDIIERTEFQEI